MRDATVPRYVVSGSGRRWMILRFSDHEPVAGPFFDKRAALRTYWKEFGR